ncbi:MAG TPA: FAD-dependent oxidoreductase, partial [Bacteroidales bacterium]|nr:FAD-dependent oxidoreductase [Bacteroidales bacterium]
DSSGLTISKENDAFTAHFTMEKQKTILQSPEIITTISANELTERFDFIDNDTLQPVTDLPYARVIEVVAAYKAWKGIPLNAFGGLIPSKEKRKALGILFTSSIFSGRTPEGGAILSVFMGGMRHPETIDLSDEEIREIALNEIKETLQTGDEMPDHLKIFRYKHAIPQYDITSEKRLKTIEALEKKHPGLTLAGNIRDGIGMADRVKQGYELAQKVIFETSSH